MNPFDFVTAINTTKKDLIRDSDNAVLAEKSYNPFLTNKALSYFPETIYHANEMNVNHLLENRLQNDYFINIVRKGKRFSKWAKHVEDPDVQCVQEYYKINYARALELSKILTKEQIDLIRTRIIKGGTDVQSKSTGGSSS